MVAQGIPPSPLKLASLHTQKAYAFLPVHDWMDDRAEKRVCTSHALPYSGDGDKRMDTSPQILRNIIQIAITAVIVLSVLGSFAGAMLLLHNDHRQQGQR
jgi:hypothetical protein